MKQRLGQVLLLGLLALGAYSAWSDSKFDDVPDHLVPFDRKLRDCGSDQACLDAVCLHDTERCDQWLNWNDGVEAERERRREEALAEGRPG